MALIKLSALASEMKGKLNGSILQNFGSNTVIRNRKSKTGRSTTAWSNSKSIMKTIIQYYRQTSQATKDAWETAALLFPFQNKFGDTIYLTGYQLFIKFNFNLRFYFNSQSQAAPTNGSFGNLGVISSSSATSASFIINWVTAAGAGYRTAVFASPPSSSASNRFPASFKFIKIGTGNNDVSLTITSEYAAIFGTWVTGAKIYISLRIYRSSTGESYQSGTLVVTAA